MIDNVFVDTNLWIYLHSSDAKQKTVEKLITENFSKIVISVQIVGEIYHTLTRKSIKSSTDVKSIIKNITDSFPPVSITKATSAKAIEISIKLKYTYWDSLIISSALENDCKYLYSEDLNHGQVIDKTLTIINPLK